jgi:hypothetical protein
LLCCLVRARARACVLEGPGGRVRTHHANTYAHVHAHT